MGEVKSTKIGTDHAEPIKMKLAADSSGPKNNALNRGHIGATWRIRWISLCGSCDVTCSYHVFSKRCFWFTINKCWFLQFNVSFHEFSHIFLKK